MKYCELCQKWREVPCMPLPYPDYDPQQDEPEEEPEPLRVEEPDYEEIMP